ncbi:hypothetical protein MesoLjLc_16770 [Mesorhizobium sp. L-8-10]|uniref:hypothetical protein n=1 Tax=unclassified Mesorhizobium TaxID=325217 RepID=UPI00192775B5|nr:MULTISPECIES: hypothetical protein [unclassified Mesorhizobium]BCH22054.1 hypothetical protein MesoLjLb_18390 [Mesorhizobium sp. L-8-3]BCH29747.1 hypothetical protein MesoLjLc_16770 [Mesorhizobium sp. L-8-10]
MGATVFVTVPSRLLPKQVFGRWEAPGMAAILFGAPMTAAAGAAWAMPSLLAIDNQASLRPSRR